MTPFEPKKTIIHFVRHGEVFNPHDILYARIPRFKLSKNGVLQAKALAQYFSKEEVYAIYHSPMLRAKQTARIIAKELGMDYKKSDYLNEIYTPYEGKPHSYLESIDWAIYKDIEEPYETDKDVVRRVRHFCQRMLRDHYGKTIIAVTHGDIVLHAQLWAREMPITHQSRRSIQPYPATASISTLSFSWGDQLPDFDYVVPYDDTLIRKLLGS